MTRASFLEALGQDYVRTARARGSRAGDGASTRRERTPLTRPDRPRHQRRLHARAARSWSRALQRAGDRRDHRDVHPRPRLPDDPGRDAPRRDACSSASTSWWTCSMALFDPRLPRGGARRMMQSAAQEASRKRRGLGGLPAPLRRLTTVLALLYLARHRAVVALFAGHGAPQLREQDLAHRLEKPSARSPPRHGRLWPRRPQPPDLRRARLAGGRRGCRGVELLFGLTSG